MMQEVPSQLWAGWTRMTVLKLGFTVWLVVAFMKLFAAPTHAGLVVRSSSRMKGGYPDAKHLLGSVWTIVNTVKVYVVIHLISLTQNWVNVFSSHES
jgi:hypothetical protein